MSRFDVVAATVRAEALAEVADFDAHAIRSVHRGASRDFTRCSTSVLQHQRHQRQQRQQRRHRERGGELVLVVEDLDVQRHACWSGRGCGRRPPTPRRTRPSRARCTGSRRTAAPHLMLGSVTRQKICQPLAPSTTRGLFLLGALRLHQRDQLARDEREGHEDRGQHDAGHREDDLDVVVAQPRRRTSPAGRTAARRSGPRSPGDTENGRSISVISTLLPRNSNLAIAHAAATPNTRFSGTAIAGGDQRELDRRQRVGLGDRGEVDADALLAAPRRTRPPAAGTGTASGTPARRRSAASAPSAVRCVARARARRTALAESQRQVMRGRAHAAPCRAGASTPAAR